MIGLQITDTKPNDLAKYGGTVYICIMKIHRPTTADGLEADLLNGKYFLVLKLEKRLDNNFRYRVNDIVKYGGIVYVCVEGHTSFIVRFRSRPKWQFPNKGIEYKGNWTVLTRYKVNDVVKHGGAIWICVTYLQVNHSSDNEAK